MGCACGKPTEVELKHLPGLCKACFIKRLRERAKKALRGLSPDDKVLLVVRQDAPSELLKRAFSDAIAGRQMIVAEAPEVDLSYDKVFVPWLADDLIHEFLGELLQGKERMPDPQQLVRPLQNITKEEMAEFARLEQLPFHPKSDSLQKFVDKLEKRYPSTKFSVLKSMEDV